MGSFLHPDSGVMRFLTKWSDIFLLGLLWLICCIPVVTVGASTTAAYYAVVKVVRRQTGVLHQEFFRSFKDNFKDSFLMNLGYLAVQALLAFNIITMYQSMENKDSDMAFYMMFLYVVLFLLTMGAALYTYPALSRFVLKRFALLKLAIFAMVRHIPTTLLLFLMILASALLMALFPIGVIFIPGLFLYWYSFFMEKILWEYMTEEMRAKWEEGTVAEE